MVYWLLKFRVVPICLYLVRLAFCFCFSVVGQPLIAAERVFITPSVGNGDFRDHYAEEILLLAMEESKEKFGDFEIVNSSRQMERQRLLVELVRGSRVTVGVSMAKSDWLEAADVVQFPLLKGLASYRLFLMMGKQSDRFKKINSLKALQQFSIGQGRGWSTGMVLEDAGFKVVYGDSYSGLFSMLQLGRFDLLMRGVYEVPPELKQFGAQIPDLAVAENIALYTYLPMYYFVSKTRPLLAKRILFGLKKAHRKGAVDALFNRYFSESLHLLNLKHRKVFYIKNTNIDPSYYKTDKKYLLENLGQF